MLKGNSEYDKIISHSILYNGFCRGSFFLGGFILKKKHPRVHYFFPTKSGTNWTKLAQNQIFKLNGKIKSNFSSTKHSIKSSHHLYAQYSQCPPNRVRTPSIYDILPILTLFLPGQKELITWFLLPWEVQENPPRFEHFMSCAKTAEKFGLGK